MLEGLAVHNFGLLRDVAIGTAAADGAPLSPLQMFIGGNASGKSTLLGALHAAALLACEGVSAGLSLAFPGGVAEHRTKGASGPLRIELFMRLAGRARRFGLSISQEGVSETLDGAALPPGERLGLASADPQLYAFLQQMVLLTLSPDQMRRGAPGSHAHVSCTGHNLAGVLAYLQGDEQETARRVIARYREKLPWLRGVQTREENGRLHLLFQDEYGEAAGSRASAGQLRLLCYLLLLEDPTPPPLTMIEEPESGLYPRHLELLGHEWRERAAAGAQYLITTHAPELLAGVGPQDVYLLRRMPGGSTATRLCDIPAVSALFEQGIGLPEMWRSDYFEAE